METKIIAAMFEIIENESDLKKLKFFGLTYRQIGELIESNIELKNLKSEAGKIVLTAKGKGILEHNKHLIREVDKSKWIGIDKKNKFKPIPVDDVFLPSSRNLSFLK